ncbi:MAG: DUF481 domain-containing protein [Kiritimatiellales bacterium]|jgi:putative salt-induced outer membrane protein YdiY
MVIKKYFHFMVPAFLLAAAGGFAEGCHAEGASPLFVCPNCGAALINSAALTNSVTVTNPAVAGSPAMTTNPAVRDWKSSIYGGFAAKSGNANSSSYNYGGDFIQNGKVYRGKLKLDGSYSEVEQQVSVSKAEASGELRRMLNEHWFAYGTLSALHDDIKNLSYRVKTGPGMGYYFADSKELTADVSSGPLYVYEKSAGVTSGYLAWRFAQGLDWQITDTFRWWVATEADVDTTDTAAYIIAFKTGIESKINRALSLFVMLEDDYDSRPEDSGKIEKNDSSVSTGVRYTF